MNDKNLTQSHHSRIYDNFLMHWKYIKREKVDGKWKYYYDNGKNTLASKNEAESALNKDKQTLKALQNAVKLNEKAMNEVVKQIEDINDNISEYRKINRDRLASGQKTLDLYDEIRAEESQLLSAKGYYANLHGMNLQIQEKIEEFKDKIKTGEEAVKKLEEEYLESPHAEGKTLNQRQKRAKDWLDELLKKK